MYSKYESDGKDLKELPLNVAVYIRTNSTDNMSSYKVYRSIIEKYIFDKTNWYISANYIDIERSGLEHFLTSEISDLMMDIEDIQSFKDEDDFYIPYDLVVVYNFEQLFTLGMEQDSYLDLGFPTFCVVNEKVICADENAKNNLIKRAKIRYYDERNCDERE